MCPPPPAPGVYQHGGVGEDRFALNLIEWISTGRRDPRKRDSGKRNTAAIHQCVHLVKLSSFPQWPRGRKGKKLLGRVTWDRSFERKVPVEGVCMWEEGELRCGGAPKAAVGSVRTAGSRDMAL